MTERPLVIDALPREWTDKYREVVESTPESHDELQLSAAAAGPHTHELEESDADVAR